MTNNRGSRWRLLLAALAVAAMTSTYAEAAAKKAARVTPSGSGGIGYLKDLLGITALEDENASQQSEINALLSATANLNATVSLHSDQIAALQECCDDLNQRLSRVEAVVDCQETICLVDDKNYCIDTDTDHEHCGECNSPCAANEDCVYGGCELKPCDPVDQCHDATLMMDGTCVQTNKSNTTPCNDGLACTVEDVCQSGVCVGYFTPCDGGTCFEDGEGGFVCE